MSLYQSTVRLLFLVSLLLIANAAQEEDDGATARRMFEALRYPDSAVRLQEHVPTEMPFPCKVPDRRAFRPKTTSVHALRPNDISVIAAMGDSLVAGNGALDTWALGTVFEYRGVSWCAGGDLTWREFLTLPNILKEYNPRLTGYSSGVGDYRTPNARLNVAFPVSSAMDTLLQAKILINRMKRDPRINFKEDWKLVTILFGANDQCSLECFNNDFATPVSFVKNLQLGLDYLQEHLPRAFINLASVIDVTVSVRVKRTTMCYLLHRMFCQCFHRGSYDQMSHLGKLARSYQKATEDLINSGRYDKREDFTVVVQPFLKMFNLPRSNALRNNEVIGETFITHDCFHFSQKGHALAANLLWNNMLEPIGNKTTGNVEHFMQRFKCPNERTPYFFTARNTKKFYATGYQ